VPKVYREQWLTEEIRKTSAASRCDVLKFVEHIYFDEFYSLGVTTYSGASQA
jgi:hypothetical protein